MHVRHATFEFSVVSAEPLQWIIAACSEDFSTTILPGEYLSADAAKEALPAASKAWLEKLS